MWSHLFFYVIIKCCLLLIWFIILHSSYSSNLVKIWALYSPLCRFDQLATQNFPLMWMWVWMASNPASLPQSRLQVFQFSHYTDKYGGRSFFFFFYHFMTYSIYSYMCTFTFICLNYSLSNNTFTYLSVLIFSHWKTWNTAHVPDTNLYIDFILCRIL